MDKIRSEQTETAAGSENRKRRHSLKRAIQKPFSPITRVLDDVESNYGSSSNTKRTLIAMWKLRAFIVVLLVVVAVASACYFAYQSRNTATAEMSLNYEEAASGLNPNATRFNAYNIASKEVVEDMLAYCGIDPASVDVNAICDAITIRSTNNKSFSEGDYFISTTYQVTLNRPSAIEGVSTEDLLDFLCKAYKDNLYSKYTETRSILDFEIDIFNDKEYLEIADLLDLKAQQLEKYLNTRAKQSKSFVESESNETFKSLVQKVEDLRGYDIDKYRTFVIETGCSADKARYINALSYTNQLKSISYNKDMAAYTVHNDGITMYDDDMISVVMIPSVDTAKRSYYMSKTKTGMDYIASRADDYLATAQETAKEITINKEIISKMKAGTNNKTHVQKATQMIEDIRNKFSDLSRQIESVDKAYVKYKTKDYLTFKTVKKTISQRLRLRVIVELCAGIVLAMYAFFWLRFRYHHKGGVEE